MTAREEFAFGAIVGIKKLAIIKLLCDKADDNDFICLGIDEICKLTNTSKPTAIATLKLLRERGVIERVKNGVYSFKG